MSTAVLSARALHMEVSYTESLLGYCFNSYEGFAAFCCSKAKEFTLKDIDSYDLIHHS